MKTTIVCLQCGETFETEETVSVGGLPQCVECGGDLTLPGSLELQCCHCDYSASVPQIDFETCVACPECGWALDVVGQVPTAAPTPSSETQPEPAENQTIALASENDASKMEEAPTIPPSSASPSPEAPNDNKTAALKPNSKFGKYEIIDEIARGAMGVVHKVRDPDLNCVLALKVMIAGENASEDLLKRFLREARAAARINHPNVVAVHEVGNIGGQYFFTMDFIEGTSFDKILAGKWMERDEVIRHIRDIALALSAAHEMEIIHRDIKPANIMYDVKNDRALLADFGLAKELDGNTMLSMTGMMMGSPAYMSPEQAKGMVHDTDHRTDIYSLGVILYETVTGEQPFSAETVVDTIRKTVFEDPIPPRKVVPGQVSKDLENIILKCMEKEPENRYQTAKELADDLTAYLKGHKVRAKAIPLLKFLKRKIKKHPAIAAAAAVSPLAAAGIALAVWQLFLAPGKLDMAAEALKSPDVKRQAGAVGDIAAWIKAKEIDAPAEKRRTVDMLTNYLKNGDPEISERVCVILERLADPKAVEPLTALLRSSKTPEKLKSAAIIALRKVASLKNVDKKNACAALLALADDKNEPKHLRTSAIAAVADIWTPSAMPALLKIAEDASEDEDVRSTAITTIGTKTSVGMPAMNSIIKFYGDDSAKVRKAAEAALETARTHASILDIYGLSGSAASASQALGKMRKAVADNQRRLMEALKVANGEPVKKPEKKQTPCEIISAKLKSANPDERLAAAYDLGVLGDPNAVPALFAALNDSDPDVIRVAGRSLLKLYPKRHPDDSELIPLLKSSNPETRQQAALLLAESDDPSASAEIAALARKESNPRVMATLAAILKRHKPAEALPLLDAMLSKAADSSADASRKCVESMAYFGTDAAPYLIKRLESPNKNIKEMALKALEKISGRKYGYNPEKWRFWTRSLR